VVGKDQATLISLTAFPFRTRGMLDGDPRREWRREQFPQVLPRILTRQAVEEIDRHPALTAADEDSRGRWQRFTVGDLKFEKTAQGWRFVFAFIEED
jgi:hypothetical protein